MEEGNNVFGAKKSGNKRAWSNSLDTSIPCSPNALLRKLIGPSAEELDDSANTSGRLSVDGYESYSSNSRLIQAQSEKSAEIEINENTTELQYNKRALPRTEPTYKLETFKKNALLIFNQNDADTKPRHGTLKDVEALVNTFEKLNFEVPKTDIHHDLTRLEVLDTVKKFTSRDFTEYGCIAIAVLSHGSNYGRLEAAKGTFYSDMQIINELQARNKHTLVTKPKILIIQACRGTKIKPPVVVQQSGSGKIDTDTKDEILEPYHLPEEADMLILHSCYVGTPCFRNDVRGSWFIRSLCQTIDRLAATHDLESIITEVKRIVSIDRFHAERSILRADQIMCQMPVLTSTLTRKLFLKKFGDLPPLIDPNLVAPLTFEDNFPLSSMEDTGPPPALSVPYSFLTIFVVYVLVSLFWNGSLNIHINLS